jgi:hypothetical protein
MSKPSMAERILHWSLRQGLAGAVLATTLLLIWSGFSMVFGSTGGWFGVLGFPNTQRVAKLTTRATCCKHREAREGTLQTWDFAYHASCQATNATVTTSNGAAPCASATAS